MGFIRKLPHTLIESFKSTLDEVREADILLHVVDISHPDFEEQINVARLTLSEIGAADKPTIMVFNKIDAYRFVEQDPYDLLPPTSENIPLEELEKTWIGKTSTPSIFISAKNKTNIAILREMIRDQVKSLRMKRYPFSLPGKE